MTELLGSSVSAVEAMSNANDTAAVASQAAAINDMVEKMSAMLQQA